MQEKLYEQRKVTQVVYEENRMKTIGLTNEIITSFRVYEDGKVGIYMKKGPVNDEEGYQKARENLKRKREYPFEPESGSYALDNCKQVVEDKKVKEIAEECMSYLLEKYPDYTFKAGFSQEQWESRRTNEAGMDYSAKDCCISAQVAFKHKDSTDLMDGSFNFSLRDFNIDQFRQTADAYLEHFNDLVEFPEELIIDQQYYGLTQEFADMLNGENLVLGNSLLAGKVGEKLFSDDFTLLHDVSDQECWFRDFWDGDGCVIEDRKLILIENGLVKTGYSDKRLAEKYHIPHTKTAYSSFADLPGAGGLNLQIKRSQKTIKELLNGRLAIIPVMSYGGGFNEKGDYTMPVHSSLLFDGEKILGKLPPFTMVSNIFDMFGKDFIGVGSDQPIYNDKQLLFRVNKGDL